MLLYQFRKGTNPRRAIIYRAEKGIDVPRYELDGWEPAPEAILPRSISRASWPGAPALEGARPAKSDVAPTPTLH